MDDARLLQWLRPETILIGHEDADEQSQLLELYRDCVSRLADDPENPTALELEAALAILGDLWLLHRDARSIATAARLTLKSSSKSERRRDAFVQVDDRYRLRDCTIRGMEQMHDMLKLWKSPSRVKMGRPPKVLEMKRG